MKSLLLFALFCTALFMAGCGSDRTFFSTAGLIYTQTKEDVRPRPKINLYSAGFYRFDICAHDTLFHNASTQWFCDCTDPKSEGSVDSFAMAFVDEIRVVFFKRPRAGREINLGNPGKETKIGVYFWDFQKPDGSARTQPRLVVRMNSPKSGNKENDFSDLFFEQRGADLELVELTYFDDDSSLVDLTRRKKKNKKTDRLASNPKEGMKTIRPSEVFALSEMLYCFVQTPMMLKLNGEEVQKIEYATDNNQGFVRSTSMKNGGKVLEESAVQKSIRTW